MKTQIQPIVFNPFNISHVILDVDGVILDTASYHYNHCITFMKDKGLPLFSFNEFLAHHKGNFYSKEKELRCIFKNIDWNEYHKYIEPSYWYQPISLSKQSLINTLVSAGYIISVVSSGHEEYIKDNFRNHGILDIFSDVLGKQTSFSKTEKFQMILDKYKISPENCVSITDTLGDISESNTVRMPSIGILGGFHDKETLQEGKPAMILKTLPELSGVFGLSL